MTVSQRRLFLVYPVYAVCIFWRGGVVAEGHKEGEEVQQDSVVEVVDLCPHSASQTVTKQGRLSHD